VENNHKSDLCLMRGFNKTTKLSESATNPSETGDVTAPLNIADLNLPISCPGTGSNL